MISANRVFDKLKNGIQKFVIRFWFYLNMKNERQTINYNFMLKYIFTLNL